MTMHVLDQSPRRRLTSGYKAFLLRARRGLKDAATEQGSAENNPGFAAATLMRQPLLAVDGPRRTRAFLRISRGYSV